MSILIDKNTRLLVQGITGRDGAFHTQQMLSYGTRVVAGVTPGRGGEKQHGGKSRPFDASSGRKVRQSPPLKGLTQDKVGSSRGGAEFFLRPAAVPGTRRRRPDIRPGAFFMGSGSGLGRRIVPRHVGIHGEQLIRDGRRQRAVEPEGEGVEVGTGGDPLTDALGEGDAALFENAEDQRGAILGLPLNLSFGLPFRLAFQ